MSIWERNRLYVLYAVKRSTKALILQMACHLRMHTGEKTLNQNVMWHLRVHFEEKPFMCTVCNKAFKRVPNMARYLRVHTGEKPFTPECNMASACP